MTTDIGIPKEKEVTCPECDAEQMVEVDDEEVYCDECGFLFDVSDM